MVRFKAVCRLGFTTEFEVEDRFANFIEDELDMIVYSEDGRWLFRFCEVCQVKNDVDVCRLRIVERKKKVEVGN